MDGFLEETMHTMEDRWFFEKKHASLMQAFQRISLRYRSGEEQVLRTQEERQVYIFTRFPGTFSAVSYVLGQLRCKNKSDMSSMLDVGAGPGTGTLAAKQIFPALRYSTLLERDCAFAEIGKELAEYALDQTLAMHWQIGDVEKMPSHALHDLVVASYSLGELAENSWEKVVIRLWRATNRAFVIVEPGTPRGYHRLMQMRQVLIQQGAYIAGPCPHQKECPLAKGDWCHFSVRVSRTSLHRKLKLAELGYEDEKFCYIICIKDSTDSAFLGKVIRHPKKGKGYIKIVTCREQGIQEETYSKKDAGLYQMMKQLEWGSDLPII